MTSDRIQARIPSKYGQFTMETFDSGFPHFPHVALTRKTEEKVVNVRIHSECMTGDVFASLRCDCGDQLKYAMDYIHKNGGIILYLRQEGRGIGLENKLKAYNLQDEGLNTLDANLELGFHADDREYTDAITYLEKIGVRKINLLTNNPGKIDAFKDTSIEVVERLPVIIKSHSENEEYMATKRDQMGHLFD
ncbi:MAG: GTP cyclohydrolase II [Flavobacteriales bacterium]